MIDLAASERRLVAALDRIDRGLDVLARMPAAREAAADGADAPPPQSPSLSPSGMADLVAANAGLIAANRALLAGADGAATAALRAETEAALAGQAVQAGKLDEVLAAIEAVLARHPAEDG